MTFSDEDRKFFHKQLDVALDGFLSVEDQPSIELILRAISLDDEAEDDEDENPTHVRVTDAVFECYRTLDGSFTVDGVQLLEYPLFARQYVESYSKALDLLQRIMQILGPEPPDVDYSIRSNVSGLLADMTSVLDLLRQNGIEFKRPTRRP